MVRDCLSAIPIDGSQFGPIWLPFHDIEYEGVVALKSSGRRPSVETVRLSGAIHDNRVAFFADDRISVTTNDKDASVAGRHLFRLLDPFSVGGVNNSLPSLYGLAAVIDWELIHRGDPHEDLAWLCLKAWRFGQPLEVGGLGTIDELVAAKNAGTGA